ncbi:hypothetical protein B0H16DRAFT_1883129, partial [Mycena metata]
MSLSTSASKSWSHDRVDLIIGVIFRFLAQLPQFDEDWSAIEQEALRYTKNAVLLKSTPFTECSTAQIDQLAPATRTRLRPLGIPIPQETQLPAASHTLANLLFSDAIFEGAAVALQSSRAWIETSRHVLTIFKQEASSRTINDQILISASTIAQNLIIRFPELDEALRIRHGLADERGMVEVGDSTHEVYSWVTVHQGVDIPPQLVAPGVLLHGKLDSVAGIMAASMVDEDLNAGRRLLNGNANLNPSNFANITEAKSLAIITKPAYNQAYGQGVAICIYAKKNSVINIVTNGLLWSFIQVRDPLQSLNT